MNSLVKNGMDNMKQTDLPNKHDNIPGWDKVLEETAKKNNKIIKRIEYIKAELAAKDRLDGYVVKGFEDELKKLKNDGDN